MGVNFYILLICEVFSLQHALSAPCPVLNGHMWELMIQMGRSVLFESAWCGAKSPETSVQTALARAIS